MIRSNKNKHYNWLMGADMYLAAAVILCDEMLKSYSSPNDCLNNIQKIDKKCGFSSANPDYEMLMPVIFNLKHGIELYIKSLIMRVNKNADYPVGHDLLLLTNFLMNKISEKGDKQILELIDKNIKSIIEKYYYGLYAFAEYKICPDTSNEAERYPEHRNKGCYEIYDLHKIVGRSLVESIKDDCQKVQNNLREILTKIYGKIY